MRSSRLWQAVPLRVLVPHLGLLRLPTTKLFISHREVHDVRARRRVRIFPRELSTKCLTTTRWRATSPNTSTCPVGRIREGSPVPGHPRSPLWTRRGSAHGERLHRANASQMVRRRTRAAGTTTEVCNHTFRATGITAYFNNGGTLEKARQMAAHASTCTTTQLYDRRENRVTLDQVVKIIRGSWSQRQHEPFQGQPLRTCQSGTPDRNP